MCQNKQSCVNQNEYTLNDVWEKEDRFKEIYRVRIGGGGGGGGGGGRVKKKEMEAKTLGNSNGILHKLYIYFGFLNSYLTNFRAVCEPQNTLTLSPAEG